MKAMARASKKDKGFLAVMLYRSSSCSQINLEVRQIRQFRRLYDLTPNGVAGRELRQWKTGKEASVQKGKSKRGSNAKPN